MSDMPKIGVDYTEEQLKKGDEESEYKFHPEEEEDDVGAKSVKSVQVRSAKSLSIPHKVSKLGVKIKEIFFNKYHANELHRQQS